jgi:hypothetical protein
LGCWSIENRSSSRFAAAIGIRSSSPTVILRADPELGMDSRMEETWNNRRALEGLGVGFRHAGCLKERTSRLDQIARKGHNHGRAVQRWESGLEGRRRGGTGVILTETQTAGATTVNVSDGMQRASWADARLVEGLGCCRPTRLATLCRLSSVL